VTNRFFIPPGWLDSSIVHLQGDTARQIHTVLRMQPGDEIVVLDNSGMEWGVVLTLVGKELAQGQIISHQPAPGEPGLQLTLYQGTLKGQKFEWVLQKGTELGVSRFTPTICQRSIVRDKSTLLKKYGRWQQIIKEAAEQCGRGKLPQLAQPLTLVEALNQAHTSDVRLMPWEEAGETTLKEVLNKKANNIALFIGPEGGFSTEEARLAQQAGIKLVTLGKRILRAETAGLAACAAIMFELGEWR
jgi:16S rRNA (uracil1498-N3)-methyltransferase